MRARSRKPIERLADAIAQDSAVDWQKERAAQPGLEHTLDALEAVEAIARGYRKLDETRRGGRRSGAAPRDPLPPPVARAARSSAARATRRGAPPRRALFTWGSLRVLESIGAGSFGEVFRAYDTSLEREVALKLWHASTNDRSTERLILEARRLARVRHPNVLVVHGADRHDDRAGMWTDLIQGRSLEQVLADQGPFGGREAALVGIELCRALAAVHAAGLVHRDVKTTNVMREHGGRIVLMDFGAVGEMTSSGVVRREDGSIGTPLTLAPELLAGASASAATDLYALGVLLYRLLSAAYPVEAESVAELAQRHRQGLRTALRERRPDLPSGLVVAVERALEPDASRRPAGLGVLERELAAEIEAAPAGPRLRKRRGATEAYAPGLAPSTLPGTVTRFVGRESEKLACLELLRAGEWLTVTGPVGCGKTRLALRVAESAAATFPAGVWFTDLESITDAERVVHAVAAAAGVPPTLSPADALLDRVRGARALLVLDHCDRLMPGVTALGASWREAGAKLAVLATCRTPLGLAGERVIELAPRVDPTTAEAPATASGALDDSDAVVREAAAVPFVGRERELEALDRALASTRARAGRAVVLRGEAGLGKSRVMREFRARAEAQGALCLAGGCAFHGGRNFEPWIAALEEFTRRFGPVPAAAMGTSHGPTPAPLFATLETMLDPGHRAAREPHTREQIWLLLDAALKRLAKYETLVLFLDDLQWGDEGTLTLLNHVIRNLGESRMLIVGAYRPEDLRETATRGGSTLEEVVRLLAPLPAFVPLELERLDARETRSLVDRLLDDAGTAAECAPTIWERAQGNPFFTIEVTRWVSSAGAGEGALPRTVTDVVMRRLARLSAEERDVLDLAAAEGESFHSQTLESALELPRMALLKRLRDLEQIHQLVVSTPGGHRFSHGLVREVLLGAMPAELRREYHGAVAEHLVRLHGERPAYAGVLAFQLWDAHRYDEAIPQLLRAAREAQRLFLNDRALQFLERALEAHRRAPSSATRRAEILRAQCDVLLQLGRPHLARSVAEESLEDERRRGDERGAAESLDALGAAALAQGDLAAAETFLTGARERYAALGDGPRVARCEHRLGAVATRRGDFEQALLRFDAALDRPAEGGELDVARIRIDVADVLYRRGEYDRAIGTFEAVVADLRRLDERYDLSRALNRLGNALFQRGRADAALAHYEEALEIATAIGDLQGVARLRGNLGNVHLVRGDSDRALGSYRDSLATFGEIGDKTGAGQIHVALGNVCFTRGEFEDAARHYRGSLKPREEMGDRLGLANSLDNLGVAEYHLGRWSESLAHHESALRHRTELGDRPGAVESALNLGALIAVLGDLENADRRFAEAERHAAELGDVRKRARALLGRACLGYWERDLDRARALLDLVDELAIEEPSIRARSCLLAGLVRGDSDPSIGMRLLEDALSLARQSGSLAEQATVHIAVADSCRRSNQTDDASAALNRALGLLKGKRRIPLLELHGLRQARSLVAGRDPSRAPALGIEAIDSRIAALVEELSRDLPEPTDGASPFLEPRFPAP